MLDVLLAVITYKQCSLLHEQPAEVNTVANLSSPARDVFPVVVASFLHQRYTVPVH